MRVTSAARNVKVHYPGNLGNLTQPMLPITCNIPNSRWNSIQYEEVCSLPRKSIPECPIIEYFYDSGNAVGVSEPCSIMNGEGISTAGTILLDAGREC
jgi:hypothetical protein